VHAAPHGRNSEIRGTIDGPRQYLSAMPPNKRPKLHTAIIQWKLPPDDKAAYVAAAKRAGLRLSGWLREAAWDRLERERKTRDAAASAP
jgi:hypothetical protein